MNLFERVSPLPTSAQGLFDYHCNPGAFQRLTPPWEKVEVEEEDRGIEEGQVRHLLIGPKPFCLRWKALHENFQAGRQFVDRQLQGPFKSWTHLHHFEDREEGGALLRDQIEYELPFKLPLTSLLEKHLDRMFAYRHRQTARDLALIDSYPGPLSGGRALRVGITGAGGFVGSALSSFLGVAGHQVVPLKRGYGKAKEGTAIWWPEPDLESLEGLDAVVHLAGETVGQLWTKKAREEIYYSRVEGTKRLCQALTELKNPPKTLLSASAVGYYEQTLDHPVEESAPPGSGFLSEVCRDWEAATKVAEQAGIRVCHLRLGLVVSSGGGFLAPQLPAFKMGMGVVLGSGRQMQSFVDLDDLLGMIYHLLNRDDLSGPFNATAPQPISQEEFAKGLAAALRRPLWMRVPEKPGRAILGQQAEMFFDGVEALPSRFLESGYRHLAPTLEESLQHTLG